MSDQKRKQKSSKQPNQKEGSNSIFMSKERDKIIFEGISGRKYVSDKIIGNGTFGVVYKAVCESNPMQLYAVKRYYKTFNPLSGHLELTMLKYLNEVIKDERILKVVDGKYNIETGEMFFVSKYVEPTPFNEILTTATLRQIQNYMYNLLKSLELIHSKGIVHRDVKPDNFLFNLSNSKCCLIDFGLAEIDENSKEWRSQKTELTGEAKNDYELIERLGKQTNKHKFGTRGFMPLEVSFFNKHQGVEVDVWAAGVMLLNLLSQRFPIFNLNKFTKCTNETIKDLIPLIIVFGREKIQEVAARSNTPLYIGTAVDDFQLKGGLNDLISKKVETKEDQRLLNLSKDLLFKMLELDYTNRITAKEALNHDFFSDLKLNEDICSDNLITSTNMYSTSCSNK